MLDEIHGSYKHRKTEIINDPQNEMEISCKISCDLEVFYALNKKTYCMTQKEIFCRTIKCAVKKTSTTSSLIDTYFN